VGDRWMDGICACANTFASLCLSGMLAAIKVKVCFHARV